MRVLTVVFGLSKGGTERAAAIFAAGYARRGHDSRLLCLKRGVRAAYLTERNVPILDATDAGWKAVLTDWKPEVVHIHSHGLPEQVVDEIVALCESAIFVETNVFSTPSPWETHLTYSFQLGEHAAALYISRGGRAEIVRRISYPLDDMSFLPREESWSARREARERLGLEADGVVVGRVGQDYMGKWSNNYIDCFSALTDIPGVRFLIINPPTELRARLEGESRIAQRLRVINCIEDDEMLRDAYLAMDVMLHIADQGESFGYAIAEAISVGTPVVSLSTPWGDNTQAEIVRTGLNGAIVWRPRNLSFATKWALGHSWSPSEMSRDLHERYGVALTTTRVEALLSETSEPHIQMSWSGMRIVAFDTVPVLDRVLLRLLFRNAAPSIRKILRRKSRALATSMWRRRPST